MLKQTPLWNWHKSHNARMLEFAGYDMPIQYTSVVDEHHAVRNAVGLFDVAHMGLLRLEGARAVDLLDIALTRNIRKIKSGRAQYNLMCNERGGTIDDVIVYAASAAEFYVVFNASNKLKDLQHLNGIMLSQQVRMDALFDDASILALQGPKAFEVLARAGFDATGLKPFDFRAAELMGVPVQLAFTGYTGEKGCEIFVSNESAVEVWEGLMKLGKDLGIQACGLAARDTLRLEMGYSLYGHELSEDINPIEAGLAWAVDLHKEDFIGRPGLRRAVEQPKRKLVALKNASKQSPRAGMRVFDDTGVDVGVITSGSLAPSLGHVIGLALVSASAQEPLSVEIRNQKIPFESTERPFYKKA
ncbi:MAG: glycine cleavage system aminomethyltransferase GcvT [Bdellovibrionota bacterium]